jgi:hypothetical protein
MPGRVLETHKSPIIRFHVVATADNGDILERVVCLTRPDADTKAKELKKKHLFRKPTVTVTRENTGKTLKVTVSQSRDTPAKKRK